MNKEIASQRQSLDHLFLEVKKISDLELQAHFARYICVLVSGFVENSIRAILYEYSSKRSNEQVLGFVFARLAKITNLNQQRIGELLGDFSNEWQDVFNKTISDEQKDAFDSILANRHQIVHGKSVGISFVRVKEYYKNIVGAIEIIYKHVNT